MRRAVAIGMLLTLFGIVGCSQIGSTRKSTADEQYEAAKSLYDRGKYYHAAEAFRLLIFNFSGVSYIDTVQNYLGMCYYNDEDYILAVAEFRRLTKSFPNSPLADDAQLMIARCYLKAAPDDVGLDQTDTYTAISELENFVEDYPDSPSIAEATALLEDARGKIAEKTFKSGEQYYKMGNYPSSRIYLESVVTDFTTAEWRGCALYLLAVIDQKEDKPEDARAKLTNLLREFPEHKWADKAKSKLRSLRGGEDFETTDISEGK